MAIKTISQFDAATPTSNDKILFEQNGEGKSAILEDLPISIKTQTALDAKVNTIDVLTYEEILATSDLKGKVAEVDSIKHLIDNRTFKMIDYYSDSGPNTSTVFNNVPRIFRSCGLIIGNANGELFFRYCVLHSFEDMQGNSINEGSINVTDNGNGTDTITISPVKPWGKYHLLLFVM